MDCESCEANAAPCLVHLPKWGADLLARAEAAEREVAAYDEQLVGPWGIFTIEQLKRAHYRLQDIELGLRSFMAQLESDSLAGERSYTPEDVRKNLVAMLQIAEARQEEA